MSVGPDDYDKVKSILDLRIGERDEMQKRIDAFSFFAEDQHISQKLVDEIETGEGCEYGVLCRRRRVKMKGGNELSQGTQRIMNHIILLIINITNK